MAETKKLTKTVCAKTSPKLKKVVKAKAKNAKQSVSKFVRTKISKASK
jgi:predicted HicB family RNase H-like nuclease